ncbi:maleylacetoacetate isomerase [Croceicoccus marinus]|uniref:Maleylacetoacetate isomerase n=1 Tax=Croceicoccus marinus TaxID=450378 RepID=A0A1Z1F888_9SPHN|nr:maleylacetoacetate isomerase [Croceicoccus marinus]ARU15021.1 maleylacetoacetate isomerase [Croceicoccus marinus]
MKLHGFFRSTASYRVRVTLALKGIAHDNCYYVLRKGETRTSEYLGMNPQGLVPTLECDDGRVLTQSLAICEYLEEIHPDPSILPADPYDKARVRALSQVIACDVHPVQNLKILFRVRDLAEAGGKQDGTQAMNEWAASTIREGLAAFDALCAESSGRFSHGDTVTLADICLVPQLVNARRFGVDYAALWPRLAAIEANCLTLDAFASSRPEVQPDAE